MEYKPRNVALRLLQTFLAFHFLYKSFYGGSTQLSFSEDKFTMVLSFIVAHLVVDCYSSVIHFFLDNYFTPETPIVGETVFFFREHHDLPRKMLTRDWNWIDTNCALVDFMLGHSVIWYTLQAIFPGFDTGAINFFYFWAMLGAPFVNTVHGCLHMAPAEQPAWYKALRSVKLVCSAEHHKKHHTTFDTSYSLYMGKVDIIFEAISLWVFLEAIIYVACGAVAESPRLAQYAFLDGNQPMYARFTNLFWNLFYALFSWFFKRHGLEIRSMNWGYHCGDEEEKKHDGDHLVLSKSKLLQVLPDCSLWEVEKFSLQLYRKTVSAVKGGLVGKDVADVSCGKGGGIRMLSELGAVGDTSSPKSVVGMDFSPVNIAECNVSYPVKRRPACLEFKCGSATSMPFADNSKDVIVSVEASHCYPSKLDFLKEARRVLRPDGRLCIVDFMIDSEYVAYKEKITEAGLELERDETICQEVIRASTKVSAVKVALIKEKMPWFMVYLTKRFTCTEDSVTINKFKSGYYDYRWFVIKAAN